MYTFKVHCPNRNHEGKHFRLTYTDTTENWKKTIPACSNVLESREVDGDNETRIYAVVGPALVDHVSFWRPVELDEIAHEDYVASGAYEWHERPIWALPVDCAANPDAPVEQVCGYDDNNFTAVQHRLEEIFDEYISENDSQLTVTQWQNMLSDKGFDDFNNYANVNNFNR